MAIGWHAPDYKLEVTYKYIIIRIYSPLCRQVSMTVYIEGRNVTYVCFPYFVRVTIPECFENHVLERFYNELLGFYSLKFTRHRYNADGFNAGAVYNEIVKSIRGVCKIRDELVFVPVRSLPKTYYGFLNMYSDRFGMNYREFPPVIELTDPDNTKAADRRVLRLRDEKEKWNEDHYLTDFMENDQIVSSFEYIPPWNSQRGEIPLTESEKRFLWKIRVYDCYNYNLNNNQWNFGELQLLDVLLAYCYNKRSTKGINTDISAWTINKLSSTLSWFEVFDSVREVLVAFYKRSLIYPRYRNWDFTAKIHSDVHNLLRSGQVYMIRALIEIHELFTRTNGYYILNKLYINNMIHFCRRLHTERLADLVTKVGSILINKTDINQELIILEKVALMIAGEEDEKEEEEAHLPALGSSVTNKHKREKVFSSSEEEESDSDCESFIF